MEGGGGGGYRLTRCRQTKYLRAIFNEEASCNDEIESRIGKATRRGGGIEKTSH